MRRKLWIMGICVVCLILIFIGNTLNQLKKNKGIITPERDSILREGEMITDKEALRLFQALGISSTDLNIADDTKSYFDYADGRDSLKRVSEKLGLFEEDIKNKLDISFDTEPDNKAMLTVEFLNLYESIISAVPSDENPLIVETLFILGEESKEGEENKVVTDQGSFYYQDAVGYDDFYKNGVLDLTNETIKTDASYCSKDFIPDNYKDSKVVALVKNNEIIYIKDIMDGEMVLSNVWITKGEGSNIAAFVSGINRDFITKYQLSDSITNAIGDLVIQDKKIIKVSLKPDTINGKVLASSTKYIEIQGYGKVDLDENYKIYKIYNELSMEVTNSILVGYDATDFVVADGKIVAALIKEPIKAENIRVLIKTNGYKDIFHEKMVLTADSDYTVTAGDVVKKYKAGDKITVKPTNKLFKEGRIRIETSAENGKIELLSLERASGVPKYRGTMEIALEDKGLIVINELSLEEYLYAVIPSEMPTSYNMEALKAQAICARSYAYNQLLTNGYSEYGAHVDDSVSCQVYNNLEENEESILAVKDTYGKVLKYNGDIITAYYFSTSCGHTASINEVWGSGSTAGYLVGKIQTTFNLVDGEAVYATALTPDTVNFSSEDTFRNFIKNPEVETYDSIFAWYRWSVTLSKAEIQKSIEKSLKDRYNANPALIQTLVKGKLEDNPVFESKTVTSIGTLKDIKVGKREESGIISELILIGSNCTIKVESEYNIRTLLAPLSENVTRQDDSTISNLTMLPSAFFVMDKDTDKITFTGGGYGHGVGMSQNGAKAMADSGKDTQTILTHYYNGVEIGFIY